MPLVSFRALSCASGLCYHPRMRSITRLLLVLAASLCIVLAQEDSGAFAERVRAEYVPAPSWLLLPQDRPTPDRLPPLPEGKPVAGFADYTVSLGRDDDRTDLGLLRIIVRLNRNHPLHTDDWTFEDASGRSREVPVEDGRGFLSPKGFLLARKKGEQHLSVSVWDRDKVSDPEAPDDVWKPREGATPRVVNHIELGTAKDGQVELRLWRTRGAPGSVVRIVNGRQIDFEAVSTYRWDGPDIVFHDAAEGTDNHLWKRLLPDGNLLMRRALVDENGVLVSATDEFWTADEHGEKVRKLSETDILPKPSSMPPTPEGEPPDLAWKDLAEAPAWSAAVRDNPALRTAAQFRDESLVPFLLREAGLDVPAAPGDTKGEALRAFARRVAEAFWEDDRPSAGKCLAALAGEADRLAAEGVAHPLVDFVRSFVAHRSSRGDWGADNDARPEFREVLRTGADFWNWRGDMQRDAFCAAAAAWCAAHEGDPDVSRALLQVVGTIVGPGQANETLVGALEETDADPWIERILRARLQRERASRLGRNGSRSHRNGNDDVRSWDPRIGALSDAWRLAAAAWRVHPEFPEAAVLMLEIESDYRPENADLWFARALEAEVDNAAAWEAYRNCATARVPWNGEPGVLRRLARAAEATHRHDTMVPAQYDRLWKLVAWYDREPWDEVLRRDEKAFRREVAVLTALRSNPNARVWMRNTAQVRLPVLLLRDGRVEAAVEANREKAPGALANCARDRDDLVGDSRILDFLGGPNGDLLVPFERRWREAGGPVRELVEPCRDLFAFPDWTDAEHGYLLRRENALRRAFPDAYDSGEWTDVPLDATLAVWEDNGNDLERGGPDGLEPNSNEFRNAASNTRCELALPRDYELEGVFEVTAGRPDAPVRFGLILDRLSLHGGRACLSVARHFQNGQWSWGVTLDYTLYRHEEESITPIPERADNRYPFRVVLRDGKVSLWIAGEPVLEESERAAQYLDPDRKESYIFVDLDRTRLRSLRFRPVRGR